MPTKERQKINVVEIYKTHGVDLLQDGWPELLQGRLRLLEMEIMHSKSRRVMYEELVKMAEKRDGQSEKYTTAAELLLVVENLSGPCAVIFDKIIKNPQLSGSWLDIDPISARNVISALEAANTNPKLASYAEEFELMIGLVGAKTQKEYEQLGEQIADVAYAKYQGGLPVLIYDIQSAFRDNALNDYDNIRNLTEPDIRLYLPFGGDFGQKMEAIAGQVAELHPNSNRQLRPMVVDLIAAAGWLISMTQGEAFDRGVCVLVANMQKDLSKARALKDRLGLHIDNKRLDRMMMELMMAHEMSHVFYYEGQDPYEDMFLEELFADVAAVLAFSRANQEINHEELVTVIMASYLGGCMKGDRSVMGEEYYRYALSANWMIDQMRSSGVVNIDRLGTVTINANNFEKFLNRCKRVHTKLWNKDAKQKSRLQNYQLRSSRLVKSLA